MKSLNFGNVLVQTAFLCICSNDSKILDDSCSTIIIHCCSCIPCKFRILEECIYVWTRNETLAKLLMKYGVNFCCLYSACLKAFKKSIAIDARPLVVTQEICILETTSLRPVLEPAQAISLKNLFVKYLLVSVFPTLLYLIITTALYRNSLRATNRFRIGRISS